MLSVHFSNRYELLLEQLVGAARSTLRGPFERRHVIVPSSAVGRSVALAIAEREGICSNVEFSYLARWLWQQISRLVTGVSETSPLAADVLTWRIYSALEDPDFVRKHTRLDSYLTSANDVMRFELAGKIASLFDEYATYRDEWLGDWAEKRIAPIGTDDPQARADEAWQAAMWRRITEEIGVASRHPGSVFAETLARIGSAGATAKGVPATAHVVALPSIPPLHVGLLRELGQVIDVHLYVLNPCQEYWFDIVDPRRLSYLALRQRDEHREVGNPLLASWGKQTQSQIDLLMQGIDDISVDDATFVRSDDGTLLGRLQNAILELTTLEPASIALSADDRSIEVHVCHSLMRELEVLQDYLLGLFAHASRTGNALRPADIVVVTPDLESAAPLIDAVFGAAPAGRRIPYGITGRPSSVANNAARTFLLTLSFVDSRARATDLFDLLQQPAIARRFQLDADALQRVREWIRASGYCWGLDGAHRARLGVPDERRHTLVDGLERLFLAYSSPSEAAAPFLDRILPAGDIHGSGALDLGGFWSFVSTLIDLHKLVSVPKPPEQWAALLDAFIDRLLEPSHSDLEEFHELRAAIRTVTETMRNGGIELPLPFTVVRKALSAGLEDTARGGVPTGSVTFASMRSLRSLPYRIVCAIGINDGTFPASLGTPEFDLTRFAPRRGDRQRRDDERALFLGLVIAARERLYLSYTGRSARDNAPFPPSVLVSELLDNLLPAVASDTTLPAIREARRKIIIEHPLQAFAPEALRPDADPRVRTFNGDYCDALNAARTDGDAATNATGGGMEGTSGDFRFFTGPLDAPDPAWRRPTLARLIEFFRNPARYLIGRRLEINLWQDAEELADDEPLLLGVSDQRKLGERLWEIHGRTTTGDRLSVARADTRLPNGGVGQVQLEAAEAEVVAFEVRTGDRLAAPCLARHTAVLAFDIDGEAWQLTADFTDLRSVGLVRARYAPGGPKDYLSAWLNHLALCASPPEGVPPYSEWHFTDETVSLSPIDPDEAVAQLAALLRLYRLGLRKPLPFYPKASWLYSAPEHDLNRARREWEPSEHSPFAEGSDASVRLAFRGQDPFPKEFKEISIQVFSPYRDRMQGVKP